MDNLRKSGLTLSVLGPFQAALDRGPLPKLATVRAQALLVYLAVEGVLGQRAQRREALTELLWPGMPPGSGRKNLRQTLYYLRQAVPERTGDHGSEIPFLIADRYKVEINPDFPLWLDVAEFLHLLNGPQEGWPQALGLYRGDFLSDFSLENSSELEGWILARRAYLQRQALDALSTLTGEAIGRRAFDQARDYAERQLDLDNLRERAHRQLMELLALDGRREEALAQYQTCRRLLQEELGMAPSARTTALYERIRAGDRALDAPLAQSARGYELKELIGQGAFGAVHRAIQPAVNREVAVKVIRRQYADDPAFIRRFDAEAQTVARLEHPHIVPLYDYWRDPDGAYLVMRYLRGGSLASGLEQRPWEPEQTARMLEQLAQALAAAHAQGVVHRDIKPANILFDQEGNAYLADFGIAKERGVDRRLTAAGAIVGTPEYISPEQILDKKVVPQSDLYSLGAVLFKTLTGEKPFHDSSVANLIHKQLHEPFPLISAGRPDLPPQIDAVIQRATAKQPADRYAGALELSEAFRLALQGRELARSAAVSRPTQVANPYKGLRPFQEADADDFFGRQALVQGLFARLAHSPFLAVIGPSGSGKSSAVKAGLIPSLRGSALPGSEKWFVAEMVPGAYPLEELEKALWPVAVDPPPSLVEPMGRDRRGILRTLGRILPPEEEAVLLLVIDQFEELFTLVDDPRRRESFVEGLLTALAEPNSPLRVVITLRADFYDRPLQSQELGHWLKKDTEVVLPLSPEELTAAISQPAARVGVELEEGLAPAIVADVQDEPGALPLLQYALTELFDRRQNGQMTLEAYREIGGVTGALARRAEELYTGLDEAGQEIARQLFLRLVTLGEGVEDTRRRVLRQELEELLTVQGEPLIVNDRPEEAQSPFTIHHSPLNIVLDTFGRYRLLTFDRDPVTRGPTVEVAHEALLRQWPRLRGWLDEGREDIRLQRALASAAAEWRAGGREEGYLLHGARLSQFESWADNSSLALTGEERAYLEASLAAREEREAAQAAQQAREEALEARSRDRLRYLVGVLATATVVAVILVIFAFGQRQTAQQERAEAERQSQLAFSRELAAAALNELNSDPELSVLLAMESLSTVQTSEAENALHQAVQGSRVRQTFHVGAELWGVDFSPDGRYVATSDRDGRVILWDVATGEANLTLEGHEGYVSGVAFNQHGTLLASAGDDNARVWDVATGRLLFSLDGHTDYVYGVAFSPDDAQLVTSSSDGTAKLWDVEASLLSGSGQELLTLSGHGDWLWNVNFNADGTRVATASSDGTARIWDVSSGEQLLSVQVWDAGGEFDGVAFSRDGSQLVAAGGSSRQSDISVWDTATGERLYRLFGHNGVIQNAKLSPDWRLLATASIDGTARIWDLSSNNRQAMITLSGHTSWVNDLAFSPDGKHLVTAGRDGTARVWDVSVAGTAELLALPAHTDEITALDYSPDGTSVATAFADGRAEVWDISSGRSKLTLSGVNSTIHDIAFSPDGSVLATAGADNIARTWDATSGQELRVLRGHEDGLAGGTAGTHALGILDLAFSPDGSRLATAGADGEAKVWELTTGQEILSVSGHPDGRGTMSVAYSPDGSWLGTGSNNNPGVIKIWDANNGEELFDLPARDETYRILQIAFSPEGGTLAIADNTGGLVVWQVRQQIGSSDEQAPRILFSNPSAHSARILGLQFSPDGSRLVTAGHDQTVKVWDSTTGHLLLTFNHPTGVTRAAFSPDGIHLLTGGLDGVIRVFALDIDELVALARSRVTRSLTTAECQRFLHVNTCPGEE